MKILFVNNIFPLFAKANSGASVRSMRLIKALTQLGHVDVISFLDDEISNLNNCDVIFSQYIPKVRRFSSRKEKLNLLLNHSNPYSVFPENPDKSQVVERYVATNNYDYIVVRYIDMSCECGLMKYSERLIIDIDDDPKAAYKMLYGEGRTLPNKLFMRYYAYMIEKMTQRISGQVFHTFNSEPTRIYPNCSFLPNISLHSNALQDVNFSTTHKNILFIGWMDYLPNKLSLKYFIEKIYPILLTRQSDINLHIVGRITDPDLLQLCEVTPNVTVCGFVDDIVAEYQQCRCVVVPLILGTGTSVKLIEAMTLNRAVVTTSVGKRGLHSVFEAGKDYLLADEANDFADCVMRLISNEEYNNLMAQSARRKIEEYYSEKKFNDIVNSVINK